MKSTYRGHEITVTREKCLGGWAMLYFSIFRVSDGYCCEDSFEDSDHTVRELHGHLKARVDNELAEADPWCERADS